jgi:hypothetical protein
VVSFFWGDVGTDSGGFALMPNQTYTSLTFIKTL